MVALDEVAGWSEALDELIAGLGSRFYREAGWQRAVRYVRGLLAPLERKNGWHLAHAAGDRSPAAMQDFLTRTRWDAEGVRDDLQAYVIQHLGDDRAVLVLDETARLRGFRSHVSRRADARLVSNANTPARPVASRIARLGCFSVTPADTVGS